MVGCVQRQALQLGKRITQMQIVRVDQIDYERAILLSEEQEIWANDSILVGLFIGNAQRSLSRLLRVAIPE